MKMLTPKQIILCKKCQRLVREYDSAVVIYNEKERQFGVVHRHSCLPAPAPHIYRFDLMSIYESPDYYRALFNCEMMNGNLEQSEVAYLLWLVYQDYDAETYFDFSEEEYRQFYRTVNEQVDL